MKKKPDMLLILLVLVVSGVVLSSFMTANNDYPSEHLAKVIYQQQFDRLEQ